MRNFTTKKICLATMALAMAANANAQQAANWSSTHINLFATHRTHAIFADFDNNGKMDIYYGGAFSNELNHKPGVWVWEPLSNLYLQNADGTLVGDFASTKCTEEPTEFDKDNFPTNGHWDFIFWKNGIIGNTHSIYATLDYNNDGLVDLIVNAEGMENYFHLAEELRPGRPFMWLYKNNGNGTFTKVDDAVFPSIYAENDRKYNNEKGEWENSWNWYHQNIAVGDYDHDGYTDILVAGDLFENENDIQTPSFCAVKLYRNINGTGKFEEQFIAKTKVAPTTNPVKDGDEIIEEGKPLAEGSFMPMRGNAAFVDLNNDGWLDIVTEGTSQNGHGSNCCFIYINEQGKSFKEVTPDTDTYSFYTLRHSGMNFADFDKDGYLDFFMTGWGDKGYNWNAFLYTNDPESAEDGFFLDEPAQAEAIGLHGTENRRNLVADINGDGFLDIHYGNGDGWVYYGSAGTTFSRPQDSELWGGERTAYGDLTGNGLIDQFSAGWVYAYVSINETPAPEAPAAPTNVTAEVNEEGKLVVKWEYEEGVAEEAGAAFNIFVKAGDKLFTLLPADPETGFLRVSQDKHTALRATVREYVMDAPAAEKFTVGVQTISNYTETFSPFVTVEVTSTGISSIKNNETAAPVYYNMQGMKVSEPKAGQVYVRKQGNKAEKFISK